MTVATKLRRPPRPSDMPTLNARDRVYDAIDRVWRRNELTPFDVFDWVAQVMGYGARGLQIHTLTEAECRRLLAILGPELGPVPAWGSPRDYEDWRARWEGMADA